MTTAMLAAMCVANWVASTSQKQSIHGVDWNNLNK